MEAWVWLEREGHYTLTDNDHARCLAVDKILGRTNWDERTEGGVGGPLWDVIALKTWLDYDFKKKKENSPRTIQRCSVATRPESTERARRRATFLPQRRHPTK